MHEGGVYIMMYEGGPVGACIVGGAIRCVILR